MRHTFFAGLMGLSGAILGCSSSVETNSTTTSSGSGGSGSGGAAVTTGVGGDTPGTTCGAVHSDTYPYGWDLQVHANDDPAKTPIAVQTGTVITWSPGTALLPGAYAVKNLASVWTSVETLENNLVVTRAPVK